MSLFTSPSAPKNNFDEPDKSEPLAKLGFAKFVLRDANTTQRIFWIDRKKTMVYFQKDTGHFVLVPMAVYQGNGWVLFTDDMSPLAAQCSGFVQAHEPSHSSCTATTITWTGTFHEVSILKRQNAEYGDFTSQYHTQWVSKRIFCPRCFGMFKNTMPGANAISKERTLELGSNQGFTFGSTDVLVQQKVDSDVSIKKQMTARPVEVTQSVFALKNCFLKKVQDDIPERYKQDQDFLKEGSGQKRRRYPAPVTTWGWPRQ